MNLSLFSSHYSKPLAWKATRPCTKNIIRKEMCDYQEITNTPDKKGITVSKSNYIDYNMLKLWQTVDVKQNLFSQCSS